MHAPDPYDWEAFFRYSFRVRRFVSKIGRRGHPLATSTWYEIAQSRTQLIMFPSLECISGDFKTMDALFMQPSVTEIRLSIEKRSGSGEVDQESLLIDRLLHSMPLLKTLKVTGGESCDNRSHFVSRLAYSFTALTSLAIPAECFNSLVLCRLGSLWNLERLDLYQDVHGRYLSSKRLQYEEGVFDSFYDSVGSDAYPSLRHLALSFKRADDAIVYFSHSYFLARRIISLSIQFVYGDGRFNLDIKTVASLICDQYRVLESLTVRFAQWWRPDYLKVFAGDDIQAVCVGDLIPFVQISTLRSFAIEHPFPLGGVWYDFNSFVKAGSRLQYLWLNPWPRMSDRGTRLSYLVVRDFAVFCPNLVRLGLFADFSGSGIDRVDDVEFQRLKELFIGRSPLPFGVVGDDRVRDLAAVSQYLSSLMPRWSEFTTLLSYVDRREDSFVSRSMRRPEWGHCRCMERWKILGGMMDLASAAKAEWRTELDNMMAQLRQLEEMAKV